MSPSCFVTCVTITHNITSHFHLSLKIKKSKIKPIKENKKIKIKWNQVYCLQFWQLWQPLTKTVNNTLSSLILQKVSYIRGLALPNSFSSMIFGWFMICNPFLHSHSSAYLISHALNPFRLYTNTSNHLDILNSLFHTPLLFYNTLWSSEVF